MFGRQFAFHKAGDKRREAPPLPLVFVVWLEAKFLVGVEDNADFMFVGAILLCTWSSLRFFGRTAREVEQLTF